MKIDLKRLLATPPPSTGWILGREWVGAVHSDGTKRFGYATSRLPEGAFDIGRVGLQGVDRALLEPVLGQLQGEVAGVRRAAVVIPTGWIRAHILDFDDLPRKRAQLEEVIRWRLKKLLPVRPGDLRLDVLPLTAVDGRGRVLCVTGLDRAFAELEETFRAVGVEPAVVTPRLFATATPWLEQMAAEHRLLVLREEDFLAMMLLGGGDLRLVRLKPLPAGTRVPIAELVLVVNYVRDVLAAPGPLEVAVGGDDEAAAAELRDWWAAQDDVTVVPDLPVPVPADPAAVAAVGRARLASACAVTAWEEA
jgi:hypothetical protein